ncbi:MAG TPA: MBL fold metallo-hydrolase [Chthoniobacterales bacterium]|jgi:glyoxylase-like metal-dependent hydrolase (beta-lactamase superfamily II)
MKIPLEDGYTDVIAKAQRGLGLADSTLAEQSGIELSALKELKEGTVDPEALRGVAAVLGLNGEALVQLAQGEYQPDVEAPTGLAAFNTPWEDFTVNSYLVWDPATRDAIVFDTGGDATEVLHTIVAEGLTVRYVLLTHTHVDHVFDLDRVVGKTGAPVFTPAQEPVEGAAALEPGQTFSCGSLTVESRLTDGHSPGGTTFVVSGLEKPIAIVGDAMFAGSMGGAATVWEHALTNNREKILTLSPETVLCPGHGPLTTVALESANNPFYPVR